MTLDDLNSLLFIAKQQLNDYEQASADAMKSARIPGAELPPEIYLTLPPTSMC